MVNPVVNPTGVFHRVFHRGGAGPLARAPPLRSPVPPAVGGVVVAGRGGAGGPVRGGPLPLPGRGPRRCGLAVAGALVGVPRRPPALVLPMAPARIRPASSVGEVRGREGGAPPPTLCCPLNGSARECPRCEGREGGAPP